MIFASFGRQKTDVDKLCISQDARGIQLGSRVFGDCDSLLSQIMQHLMNRNDLQKWEMERTVRMRAYDKKRTKSWSNSHYLSILLRHTLCNFHTLQVCWLFMPAVSLLLENLWGITQNKQHKPLATGAQTSDMLLVTRGITGTCTSFSLWHLHVTCVLFIPMDFWGKETAHSLQMWRTRIVATCIEALPSG